MINYAPPSPDPAWLHPTEISPLRSSPRRFRFRVGRGGVEKSAGKVFEFQALLIQDCTSLYNRVLPPGLS